MALTDLPRKTAPSPLRAKAGFAKTHSRPDETAWIDNEDELDAATPTDGADASVPVTEAAKPDA